MATKNNQLILSYSSPTNTRLLPFLGGKIFTGQLRVKCTVKVQLLVNTKRDACAFLRTKLLVAKLIVYFFMLDKTFFRLKYES